MFRWTIPSILVSLFVLTVVPGATAEVNESQRFMRIRRDAEKRPIALETSIASYQSRGTKNRGVQVDLIGAIHVGDEAYYDQLNDRFASYEVVLYELVAPPEGAVPVAGKQRANLLTSTQLLMKNMLDLQFQLDGIDYAKENFVHADFSPTEFRNRMHERGESFTQMFFRMMGDNVATQTRHPFAAGDAAFLAALISKDRSFHLKRLFAKQFEYDSDHPSSLDGPDGSTIISERNKRAMDVLASQLKEGKKRVAIFYGAAHLRDMEQRLRDRFQFQRSEITWITAWDLAAKKSQSQVAPPQESGHEDEADDDDPF